MKKQLLKFSFLLFGASALLLTSCEKDKDEEENEEEVITTMELKFQPASGNALTYKFEDLDGDGGAAPTIQDIVLAPNTVYDVSILLLNKSVNPADTISNEVEEESVDHQFYFVPAGVNISVNNLDTDTNGLPLGLTSMWTTAAAGTGKMQVILKHKPGTKAAGDPVSKGETDIELPNGGFTVKVQ